MIISYDISDDRRRRKIMQTLEDFGRRVQFSVFECLLLPVEFEKLQQKLVAEGNNMPDWYILDKVSQRTRNTSNRSDMGKNVISLKKITI